MVCNCKQTGKATLASTNTPQFLPTPSKPFSTGLLSIYSLPRLYLCLGLPSPRCRTSHLPLLELHEVCPGPHLKHSTSLRMASLSSSVLTATHSLVLYANLIRVHSIPAFITLTKMLNSAAPHTSP